MAGLAAFLSEAAGDELSFRGSETSASGDGASKLLQAEDLEYELDEVDQFVF